MVDGICASCYDFSIDKVIKSSSKFKPTWLKNFDYVSNFINNVTNFSEKKPKSYNVVLKINLGKQYAKKKILYWAATPQKDTSILLLDAKHAYSRFENSGIGNINNNGEVILKFMCPQPYRVQRTNSKKVRTFFRHLHFVISNNENNEWLPQIYTKIVVCKLDFNKAINLIRSNNYVIINALPSEYYGKDHIPNSYNLNKDMIKKMTVKELENWVKDVVELHYPKINNLIKNKKLEIYELPLLFYCAHSKCNASDLAIKEIMKKGFVNVQEFSGGIEEYRKNIPFDK